MSGPVEATTAKTWKRPANPRKQVAAIHLAMCEACRWVQWCDDEHAAEVVRDGHNLVNH